MRSNVIGSRTGKMVRVSTGAGRFRIVAEAKFVGDDVVVLVWGGSKPHVGSVALSVPRASLGDPEKTSATSSVLNLVGHKDDMVSKLFSDNIASALNINVVTTAGIHVDQPSENDLDELLKNAEKLCSLLIVKLKNF